MANLSSIITPSNLLTASNTQTVTNKTISADNNTLSGVAASSFVLSNASGNIDGSAAQKVIPTGDVVGTSDTQTLTNKTLVAPVNLASSTATQDGIIVTGRAGGSSSYRLTVQPATLSASRTVTLPDGGGNYAVGYQNLPAVGTKTGSYTLATTDVGKYVQVGTGGSITIPDATFSEGDVVLIANNTTGAITITCTITTAYIGGTDTDKATVSLATRGVANILFLSGTVCIITGNVS